MTTALDLKEEILTLKKQRNAVILAHNYQIEDIQDVADYVGDSLGLAYHAKSTDADVIAFCGVHFIAETAKIVNPGKTVILPDRDAGCSLEQSCPAAELEAFLKDNAERNYYVIAYINCSGGVKALCDVICTSANAVTIVNQAPSDRPILFVPDENLGAWVMEQTGRRMDSWKGSCYVHVEFTRDSIRKIKDAHPDALVVDEVCSTEKMISYCKQATADRIIVVTESGMLHRLRKECPDKKLIPGRPTSAPVPIAGISPPISPPSGPAQRLFQEPPAKSRKPATGPKSPSSKPALPDSKKTSRQNNSNSSKPPLQRRTQAHQIAAPKTAGINPAANPGTRAKPCTKARIPTSRWPSHSIPARNAARISATS